MGCCRDKYQWMDRATGPWTSPLPPAVVNPVITSYTKFEMEGNFKNQPFIAYGALFAAPARDDSLCPSRRDYTYAVSHFAAFSRRREQLLQAFGQEAVKSSVGALTLLKAVR